MERQADIGAVVARAEQWSQTNRVDPLVAAALFEVVDAECAESLDRASHNRRLTRICSTPSLLEELAVIELLEEYREAGHGGREKERPWPAPGRAPFGVIEMGQRGRIPLLVSGLERLGGKSNLQVCTGLRAEGPR